MDMLMLSSGLAFMFIIGVIYLVAAISRHRMKNSKYGHSFDFSKMPKQKIAVKKKPH